MTVSDKRYAYCANESCPHLMSGNTYPDDARGMFVREIEEGAHPSDCPYCGVPMKGACPGCGHVLDSRPMRFCPFCGVELLKARPEVVNCRVCGRPIMGAEKSPMDIPLCSERCISEFIARNVRVCDQCGKRFNAADEHSGGMVDVAFDSEDGAVRDFCSVECMNTYAKVNNCNEDVAIVETIAACL